MILHTAQGITGTDSLFQDGTDEVMFAHQQQMEHHQVDLALCGKLS